MLDTLLIDKSLIRIDFPVPNVVLVLFPVLKSNNTPVIEPVLMIVAPELIVEFPIPVITILPVSPTLNVMPVSNTVCDAPLYVPVDVLIKSIVFGNISVIVTPVVVLYHRFAYVITRLLFMSRYFRYLLFFAQKDLRLG